jgi:hypothetical protein
MKYRAITPILLLLAAALVPGCETLDEPESSTQTVNLAGRVVVLIIDNSGGPEAEDPKGYIREGGKFLLSTLDTEDNLGVVTCRFPADVLSLTESVDQTQRRGEILQAIDEMEVGGECRYTDALNRAAELLGTFHDPEDSYVILLTGGREKPVGEETEIEEIMRRYGREGWRVFPVVLAPTGHMELLEKMAVLTRGAIFKVEKPEHLLTSLSSVSAEITRRLLHRGIQKPNALMEGAGDLVLAVTNRGELTGLSEIRRGGKTVPLPPPDQGLGFKSPGYFHVVHLPAPESGEYEAKVDGDAIDEFMFLDAPFEARMSCEGTEGVFQEGQPIRLALAIEAQDKGALKALMEQSRVTASIQSERTGKTVTELPLEDFSLQGERVVYEGTLRAVTSEPGESETFTAKIALQIEGKNRQWTGTYRRSFLLEPASPLLFQVEPGEIDLGTLWADDRGVTGKLSVTARAAHGLKVEIADVTEGLVVTPEQAVSQKDTPVLLQVALGDVLREGETGSGKASFRIKASSAAQGEFRFEKKVAVLYNLITYRGTGDLVLEDIKPGESRRLELAFETEPEVALDVRAGNLVGPAVIPLLVEGEGPSRTIVLNVPDNCLAGSYVGKLEIAPKGAPLAPRSVKVEVRVVSEAPVEEAPDTRRPVLGAEPAEIKAETAADGWVEGALTLGLGPDDPPATVLAVERTALQGADEFESISGEFDFLTEAGPGWDGREIGPGRTVQLEYRVFVAADLPDGTYRGKVTLRYRGTGKKEYTLDVPVEVTVKRAGG